ncbi:MAG: hypothetical protein OHK0029_36120 [Armatimonadaceae bacterium]
MENRRSGFFPGRIRYEGPIRDPLAYERTVLANERTLLAYARTALAFAAAGLGLLNFAEPRPSTTFLGYFLVVSGVVFAVMGVRSFLLSYHRTEQNSREKPDN